MDLTERWVAIPGYVGSYEVSDLGRVRSLPRQDAIGRSRKGTLLSPAMGRGPTNAMSTKWCTRKLVRDPACNATVRCPPCCPWVWTGATGTTCQMTIAWRIGGTPAARTFLTASVTGRTAWPAKPIAQRVTPTQPKTPTRILWMVGGCATNAVAFTAISTARNGERRGAHTCATVVRQPSQGVRSDMDMSESIIPKSDQLNAEDMIAGPQTYTIREVRKGSAEQPFDFMLVETDRAYRPSKTMRRLIVAAWGPDANLYVGRRLTLYREPSIKFGGQAVGGLRVSHLSHISKRIEEKFQTTRGKRETFTVSPLPDAPPVDEKAAALAALRAEWDGADADRRAAIKAEVAALSGAE